jgi:hypothetical protein
VEPVSTPLIFSWSNSQSLGPIAFEVRVGLEIVCRPESKFRC